MPCSPPVDAERASVLAGIGVGRRRTATSLRLSIHSIFDGGFRIAGRTRVEFGLRKLTMPATNTIAIPTDNVKVTEADGA